MKIIILLLPLLALSCGHGNHKTQHETQHKGHHRFQDAEKWAKRFEKPSRDKWQKPEEVLKYLSIRRGDVVADIGSATGYFPIRVAKKVPSARVWAIDIEPNLVRYLNERLEREKVTNAHSILGTPSDPLIPERVDFVVVVDTYHHIQKRIAYFKNIKRYLKKNSKVAIIDFKKGDLPFGPSDKMKLAPSEVIKELKAAGFNLKSQSDFLPYQYILIFENNGKS